MFPFVVWAGRPACGPRLARRPRPAARGSPAARTRPASPCARACGGGSGAVPVRSRGSGGQPPGRSASRRCATAARRPSRRCWCAGRGPRDGLPRRPPAAAASRPPPSRCGPCRWPARRSRRAGWRTDGGPAAVRCAARPSPRACRALARQALVQRPRSRLEARAGLRCPPAVPMATARLASKTRRRSRLATRHRWPRSRSQARSPQWRDPCRARRPPRAARPGPSAWPAARRPRRRCRPGPWSGALEETRLDRVAVAQQAVAGAVQGVPAHGLAVAAEQLAQGAALAQPVPRGALGGRRGHAADEVAEDGGALRTGQAQLLEQGRRTELPHGPQGDVLDADRARADQLQGVDVDPRQLRCAGPRPRPRGSRPRARGSAGGGRGCARRGRTAPARPRAAGRRGGRGCAGCAGAPWSRSGRSGRGAGRSGAPGPWRGGGWGSGGRTGSDGSRPWGGSQGIASCYGTTFGVSRGWPWKTNDLRRKTRRIRPESLLAWRTWARKPWWNSSTPGRTCQRSSGRSPERPLPDPFSARRGRAGRSMSRGSRPPVSSPA